MDHPSLIASPASPTRASCPHCGRSPKSEVGVCTICGQPLCNGCVTWHSQTMYCPNGRRSKQVRDAGWLERLNGSGRDDLYLATQARLREGCAVSKRFQDNLAISITSYRRRNGRIRRLLHTKSKRPSRRDLGNRLVEIFSQRWALPKERGGTSTWQPPRAWLDDYRRTTQLLVYVMRNAGARPTNVAVATVTPVEFHNGRGPALLPCDAGCLACVERVLLDSLPAFHPGDATNVYLVIQSTTGFTEEVQPSHRPGLVSVLAEPHGDTWSVTTPPMDGMPQHVQTVVGRLSPETVHRKRQRIRDTVESHLELSDFVTVGKVRKGIDRESPVAVSNEDVLAVFNELAASSRYAEFRLANGECALRPTTYAERDGYPVRRRRFDLRHLLGRAAKKAANLLRRD